MSESRLTITELKRLVTKECKKKGLDSAIEYFKDRNDSILNDLWGEDKTGDFVINSLLVTLFKDITHDGYQRILRELNIGTK